MKKQIAIDGPASSGKSTISKKIAQKLNYIYVDTGAMYRAITFYIINEKLNLNDENKINNIIDNIDIELISELKKNEFIQKIYLNKKDVSNDIRSINVTNNVSLISSYKSVRDKMTLLQRKIADENNVIMDGRDIGTTVLPNAQTKIYLTASVYERALRRYKENKNKNINCTLEEIKQNIIKRDELDSSRNISPLKKANDAFEIDTTNKSIEDIINKIINIHNNNNNTNKKEF